ncbi:MAG: hypothetical protein A3D41_03135 [Candidatus Sungbacteria bacterium RIFCSPHIGHO2_02_FULL_41_12b]|nr:MAG: hypothetical protein A3D41_03135 [Candidatus Sungbacteria bacterium RIFCSPHIGHO2_02_FULL_41_12b]
MKIIMLSIDKSILRDGSEAQERMKEYGSIAEELHIIVYTDTGFKERKISENAWVYPTNTVFKLFYFFNAYRIAKRIIHNSSFIIHNSLITSQDAFTNIVAFFLKKKFGLSLQAQIHTDFLSPFFKSESWKNYIRYLLYPRTIKKADCVRVVSERIKSSIVSILKIYDSKISVLPIFIDAEKIKKTPVTYNLHKKYPEHDFIVLMASRLTREKNIETACLAFGEVVKVHSKSLLVIVGEGPLKKTLKEKYENLGKNVRKPSFPSLRPRATEGSVAGSNPKTAYLEIASVASLPRNDVLGQSSKYSNIIFEDAVSYEMLVSYYKTADLFLLTSNYEGYGRTIIEALASGLPVFSTDVGIASEVIKDGKTGKILPVGISPKNLASELIKVFSEDDLYNNMKQNVNDFASFFSMPSKEEYLLKMKAGFESCAKK